MVNNGCYENCTNCNSEIVCCSYFDKINAPVLNKEELQRIKEFIKSDEFYNIMGDNLFSLKLDGNNCVFYQNDKCLIYDIRPIDCRLYPFDIIKIENKFYLILYLLSCIDYKHFYNESLKINPLIDNVIPWIKRFTDEQNYTKMKTKKYKIIRELDL